MAKKRFYAVKYADGTGRFVNKFEDYIKAIRNYSGCSSKGFNDLDKAKAWLDGNTEIDLSIAESDKGNTLNEGSYFAIANGRYVGITKSEKKFLSSVTNYPRARSKAGFPSKRAAITWLKDQGITPRNKKGIYSIAVGSRTGVFTNLNTFEKNMYGFPNALGKGGFETKKEAFEWLENHKSAPIVEKEFFGIAFGKRTGVFSKEETYLKNIQEENDSWAKRGFKTKEDAKEWVQLRREFARIGKDPLGVNKLKYLKELPVVYIDGSYYPKEKSYGSSVVICQKNGSMATFSCSEHRSASSTFAEVVALRYSIQLMIHLYHDKEFILVYDHENLDRMAKGETRIKSISKKLQESIVNEIKGNQLKIHFFKVKSHAGFTGNNLADKLAKESVERIKHYPSLFSKGNGENES